MDILPVGEEAYSIKRSEYPPLRAGRYLFTAGYAVGAPLAAQSFAHIDNTLEVNFVSVVAHCDAILDVNPDARICIIGSESGETGAYDMAYSGAKAAIHLYIRTKRLQPNQQLVGIAPWVIEDSGMTERRSDKDRLPALREGNPKKRFLTAFEVAMMVYHLLYVDRGYTTGCVIPMNGGRRA